MPIDEKAFEAFMTAYWENGPTGLGMRKSLEAYEAAKGSRARTGDELSELDISDNDPCGDAYGAGYAAGYKAKVMAPTPQPALPALSGEELEKAIDIAAKALWERDYPVGGSLYKTYESTNYPDKETYRKEVRLILAALELRYTLTPKGNV